MPSDQLREAFESGWAGWPNAIRARMCKRVRTSPPSANIVNWPTTGEIAGLQMRELAKSVLAREDMRLASSDPEWHRQDIVDHAAEVTSYPACKGMNCGTTDGVSHSPECQAEHAAFAAGGRFVKGAEAARPELSDDQIIDIANEIDAGVGTIDALDPTLVSFARAILAAAGRRETRARRRVPNYSFRRQARVFPFRWGVLGVSSWQSQVG
ncbi:protein of unknown function [Ralstonia solanacearum CMR15]|nr:protein of unknown function [Ralstonia solanacearum CMR15]